MNFNKIDNLRNQKSSKLTVTWVPRDDRRRVNVDDPEDELESFWFKSCDLKRFLEVFNEKIVSVRDVFDRERLLRDDPYLYILGIPVFSWTVARLFKWVFIKRNMPSYR